MMSSDSPPSGMRPSKACRSALGEFDFGPFKYLFPLAALLTLLVCARDWRSCLRDRLLWPCAAFGSRGLRGVLSAPRYHSYRLCSAFGLPLACILHDPAHPTVASSVVAVSLPGCRGCRCRDRALCFFCPFFLWISQQALRAEIVPTPRGGVAFFGVTWGTGAAGADRGDAIRGCLFLLSILSHAIIPDCARAGVEIRSLCARIHPALPVSGCLYISDAACFLGRHRSARNRSQRTEAGSSCDAGR